MASILIFLLILKSFLSFNIYIDSSYQNNDSDGSSSKPFKDSNIISQIIENGTAGSFLISNYFLISSQIIINNAASEIFFRYLFIKICFSVSVGLVLQILLLYFFQNTEILIFLNPL